jgi:hypothetical protein
MANLKEEKLKDLIINFLYDYTKNEKVQIVEAGSFRFEGVNPEVEPKISEIIKEVRAHGGNVKAYYGTRESDYCVLIYTQDAGKSVPSSLRIRLEKIGLKNPKKAINVLEKNIAKLEEESYIRRDSPNTERLQLTEKGLKHYLEGKSFESEYLNHRNVRQANRFSLFSLFIALCSLIFSFWNPFQKRSEVKETENEVASRKEQVVQGDSVNSVKLDSTPTPSTTSKTSPPAPKTAGQK